jgi:hypothetical protein
LFLFLLPPFIGDLGVVGGEGSTTGLTGSAGAFAFLAFPNIPVIELKNPIYLYAVKNEFNI